MNRRSLLKFASSAAVTAAVTRKEANAQEQVSRAARGMKSPIIRDVKAIATAPAGLRLVVVKITTDQDGLYGYGCATFTQRADLVVPAVDKYLKPLLVGRPADRIDDAWQLCYNSSYWRNGPVLNNAISGVDQALWDIKGRQAGLPIYQLLGGKCREAADCYGHASGAEIPEIIDSVRQYMSRGFRHVRVQIGVPGQAGYGAARGNVKVEALHNEPVFEAKAYIRRALKLFEACRKELGDEIELLHDVHERVLPQDAVQFAKDVEKFKLFFLEDLFSPNDIEWFRRVREQCATPLSIGEIFNHPHEIVPLLKDRLIDYLRLRVAHIGGITPARKYATIAEPFGVKTAWQGPGNISPVGHAAHLMLDLAAWNFGVQEGPEFNNHTVDMFPGSPEVRDGFMWSNGKPGLGIEIDEKLAASHPHKLHPTSAFDNVRRADGTVVTP